MAPMYAPPLPASADPLLPAYVRAAGGVRLRFGLAGEVTRRLTVAESGGYRARFPDTYAPHCEAVLINTGGGMAGGDAMRCEIGLDAGAQAVVTTQAAEKIYRSQGADTTVETRISVAEGASLAWLPQETILFSGSRLRRSFAVDLAPDARFLACETLFFGRAAMGETLERGSLRDRWRLRRGGRLVFAEHLTLAGAIDGLLARPALGGGARAVATVVEIAPDPAARLEALRERLLPGFADDGVEAAAGLIDGLIVVRLLSREAQSLRRAAVMLLGHLTGRALPRTWST